MRLVPPGKALEEAKAALAAQQKAVSAFKLELGKAKSLAQISPEQGIDALSELIASPVRLEMHNATRRFQFAIRQLEQEIMFEMAIGDDYVPPESDT